MSDIATSALSDPDDLIKNRLKSIFPTPEVQRKIIDLVTSKRPKGWSCKSNATYFKEEYALQIKDVIDQMVRTREPVIYRYSIWCSDSGMSNQTLYTRINQSIRFLIECMDTDDHYYARWYQTVDVERKKGLGVCITFIPEFKDSSGVSSFKPEFVQNSSNLPKWKREMDEWLESDTKAPFVKERLALSVEEVSQIKIELAGLKNILADVASTHIKIIRLNGQ